MTDQLHTAPVDHLELRADPEGDGRTLELRLLPWGQVGNTVDGPEVFRRGAFEGTDPAQVRVESMRHGGALVGRGTAIAERDDAAYLTTRISRTHDGDDLLELVRDGTLNDASVVFAEVPRGSRRLPDGVMERSRVDLRRVAILERGAYPGAGVVAVREAIEMPDATIEVTGPVVEAPPAEAPAEAAAREQLAERMDRIDARLGAIASLGGAQAPREYRADTLGQLLMRSWSDEELSRAFAAELVEHQRALSDQITTDNPGLVRPGVLSRSVTIINRGRPGITAQGTGSLPAEGMTVNWPVMTTPLTGLIAKQTAEKAAVVSAKVSFGNASAPVQTFAGASDVAYQLIRRSSPSYLEAYSRAMLAAWSHVTDTQFGVDVLAAGTGSIVLTPVMPAKDIVTALVQASIAVEAATGQPATSVVVAYDLFAAIAAAFAPTSVNPTSQGGTAMASTLRVNVSGLDITLDPFLAAGKGWVSNQLAAEWLEDGPFTITVDDAEKIGQNTAYWSLGVSAIYVPAGVVKIAAS